MIRTSSLQIHRPGNIFFVSMTVVPLDELIIHRKLCSSPVHQVLSHWVFNLQIRHLYQEQNNKYINPALRNEIYVVGTETKVSNNEEHIKVDLSETVGPQNTLSDAEASANRFEATCTSIFSSPVHHPSPASSPPQLAVSGEPQNTQ